MTERSRIATDALLALLAVLLILLAMVSAPAAPSEPPDRLQSQEVTEADVFKPP